MKILFVLINMNLGGTEKSFLNLVENLSQDYEITLLLLENSGDLLNDIPQNVNLQIIENSGEVNAAIKYGFSVMFCRYLREFNVLKSLKTVLFYIFSKIDKKTDYYYLFFKSELPKLSVQYDFAVSYAGPHNFISNYVIDKVTASKKIQWIHFDVSKIYFNKAISRNIYSNFDTIVCVSEDVKNQFLNLLPQFITKTIVKHNLISFDKIDLLSMATVKDINTQLISIVTVGRLTKEKGHEQFLTTFRKLKDKGYKFCWYIVGDGNQMSVLKEKVEQLKLNDSIKFLGKKSNPYPYYKSCDIYLQPSFYEGHCVSILEAKFFKKAIVCTNFSGASEEIIAGQNGLIVDFDEDSYYNALEKLITNDKLRLAMGAFNEKFKFKNQQQTFDAYISS